MTAARLPQIVRRFAPILPMFVLAACSQHISPAETPPRVITGGVGPAEQQSAALKVAQTVEVRLRSQSGTGYAWRLASGADNFVVARQTMHTTDVDAANGKRVGGATWDVFTLRAAQPGDATVEFVYERPWEKTAPPARRFTLKVHVER